MVEDLKKYTSRYKRSSVTINDYAGAGKFVK